MQIVNYLLQTLLSFFLSFRLYGVKKRIKEKADEAVELFIGHSQFRHSFYCAGMCYAVTIVSDLFIVVNYGVVCVVVVLTAAGVAAHAAHVVGIEALCAGCRLCCLIEL